MKLKEAIDSLGKIIDKKKELEKKEKKIKEQIKKLIESKKIKVGKYTGAEYELSITESITAIYDSKKVADIVGIDIYIENSKPNITALKDIVGAKALDKAIVGENKSYRISTSKIK